ncbi:MAG: carboxypeptidase regulatory-like domain-containing protein [Deltaproteobacteria bacterium]
MRASNLIAVSLLSLTLIACGQGIVSSNQPLGPPSSPGATTGPSAPQGALPPTADAGPSTSTDPIVDAGPGPGMLSGRILQALGGPLASASVTLRSTGQVVSTVASGDYYFPSVPPGPFELDIAAPGFVAATVTGSLAPGEAQTEPDVTLERSNPLLVLDGGSAMGWLAFAPDGGGLFAADPTTLWSVGFDFPSAPVVQGAGLSVLGFTSSGYPVALHDCSETTFQDGKGGIPGQTCTVNFAHPSGKSFVIEIASRNPPLLLGDAVLAPTSPTFEYFLQGTIAGNATWTTESETWQSVSESAAFSSVVSNVSSNPAPVATSAGLVGYQVEDGGIQPFNWTPNSGLQTMAAFTPFALPWSGALSEANGIAAMAVLGGITPTFLGPVTTVGVAVVGETMGQTFAGGQMGALQSQGETIESIFAISPFAFSFQSGNKSYIQNLSGASCVVSNPHHVFPAANGDVFHLDGNTLTDLSQSRTIPFPGAWSTPVVSQDGTSAVFPGTPLLFDLEGFTSVPLPITPSQAVYSPDGKRLLLLAQDGSLHTVMLGQTTLSDVPLEGKSSLAIWTPDSRSVVYAGSDPSGRSGIFVEPLPAP